MDYAIQGQHKHWWNRRAFRIIMVAIGAALVAIPFANIADFFGLWLVVAGTSFIIIRIHYRTLSGAKLNVLGMGRS
jgi:diacylglycerol kinase